MTLSGAVFGPQSKAPSLPYLDSIQSFISHHQILQCIVQNITTLRDVWYTLAKKPEIARLSQVPRYMELLIQWLVDSASDPVASTSSGIVALPRLVIIQITQYFQFLESRRMTHADFITQVRDSGGVQGYCGGLPAALAVACAKSEEEVVQISCTAIRLAFAIGIYAELGDDADITGFPMIVVRLKREGQAEELVQMFPGTYISAITHPKAVSIVGPVKQLADLQAFASKQGLLVQSMDLRGKVHNPENGYLAMDLAALCQETALLAFPGPESLLACVRSNRSGDRLTKGSLTEEIVQTVLASRCEWFKLLSNVAVDLKLTGINSHSLVSFGIGDCVPLMPFNGLGLQLVKIDGSLLRKHSNYLYPADAIAVVGASCRLPGANNLDELWDLVSNGVDRHEELPSDRFDLRGGFRAAQSGNFVKSRKFYGNFIHGVWDFDGDFFSINKREMANVDPQQRILLELSYEAMESSGYTRSHVRERGDSVGCFIGASFVEYLDNTNSHPPTAYTSTGTIRAFLCGRLSYHFGWTGPAEVIDTACSSSLVAINRACKAIQGGECSIAIAGGVNLITGANNFLDLARAGFLSPTGQCKPFDQNADGYCRSEGAGLVVLKTLKQARIDGDHVMAVIPGTATNQGGLSCGITVPHSLAQTKLYEKILKQAAMDSDQVTYVEAHGTGTQVGDPIEVASIRAAFGNSTRDRELHIGSIKGNIGHCETAAGVAGLLKVIAMLEHRAMPPQANHKTLNPKIPALSCDQMVITKELRTWDAPFCAALVNSYGAAGSNCALLCCEGPKRPLQRDWLGLNQPVVISAASASSLKAYTKSLVSYLTKATPQLKIADIAYTLSEKRQRHRHCITLETNDTAGLVSALSSNQTPAFERSSPKPVVLVFGGQSKGTIGLRQELYEHFTTFRTYIDMCDGILRELGCPPILPAIFETETISDIVVLQTGLVAVQYASALTWIDANLKVDALVGHSLGELTALAVSGMLSVRDCLKLVAARADLMKRKWGQDKGSMLAVFASQQDVEQLLIDTRLSDPHSKLEIACYNSETCQVVSGDCAGVADLENHLLSRSSPVRHQHVDASHAFHSRLVEPILDDLDEVCVSLDWKEPTILLESCAPASSKSCLMYSPSNHARNPVYFSDAVQRIERRLGHCIWLEAGSNTPIIPMTKRATSQPHNHIFHAMSTRDDEAPLNLISGTVCSLWKSSVDVSHWSFMRGDWVPSKVWLPPYQFDATTAWLDNIDRAAEVQHQRNERPDTVKDGSPPLKPKMVTLLPDTKDKGPEKRFKIFVEGERFRRIVAGHAVRGRSLCPASVYLECAAMAIDIVEGNLQKSTLDFDNLDIQSPLGIGSENVELILLNLSIHRCWEFTVVSRDHRNQEKTTVHAKGHVTVSSDSRLETLARLLGRCIQALAANDETERMLSKRAYDLFSRVVTYEKFLRGIASISMSGTEAFAKLVIAPDQPGLDESTVVEVCDAVSLDNFIQVVGLLMNTSDLVGSNEVMVCTGIEKTTISKGCNMVDRRSWEVHASFTSAKAPQAIGDVFAFEEDGSVAAAFTGCRFTKLNVTRLERMLDTANHGPGGKQGQKLNHCALSSSSSQSIDRTPQLIPDTSTASPTTKPLGLDRENSLREMFEAYTDAASPDILDGAMIADLGLEGLLSSHRPVMENQELVYSPYEEKLSKRRAQTVVCSKTVKQAQQRSKLLTNKLTELLSETTAVPASSIKAHMILEELGVDSLALTEILSTLEGESSVVLKDEISLQSRVEDVLAAIGALEAAKKDNDFENSVAPSEFRSAAGPQSEQSSSKSPLSKENRIIMDPKAGQHSSNLQFEHAARIQGFAGYWKYVAIEQDKLVIAYILEAFKTLGVDFTSLEQGDLVPDISYLPKHSKVVQRLWDILEKHGIIGRKDSTIVRGAQSASIPSSAQLHVESVNRHARYAIEAQLMALTGSRLAECLTGNVDPIRLLFGTASSVKILEEYYERSPMLSTMTDQLVALIIGSIGNANGNQKAPLRILEVGAGTGGTTARLLERFEALGISVEYTFSDVSRTMVSKAKKRFVKYSCLLFEMLDLEQLVPPNMRGRFDIIIGTNCVHATKDRVATISRLREMLSNNGFVVLSEVTRVIDWYDIVFGLLEGWWLADGGFSYPLQPAEAWMSAFRAAGFPSAMFSQGVSEESNTQQLLVGCNGQDADASESLTVVYKKIGGTQIEADIYLPAKAPAAPMPIAFMLHGGGYMTLSRRAIRPAQTAYLLANGILPISLDYRLCPEINLIDGAMADICDSFRWARATLPFLLSSKGIAVDSERIVVIGWSTGGHLAMSTAWMVEAAGEIPPKAILSFYAPTDFLSQESVTSHAASLASHSLSREEILQAILPEPISNYDIAGADSPELCWIKSGDPRSKLLLSLFRESREYGLSLMLNGEHGSQVDVQRLLEPSTLQRQAAICPTARLRAGEYNVPTYIVHGDKDQIASFEAAAKFQEEMSKKGIKSGFLAVKGGHHIHDLRLKPGMVEWDEQVAPGYKFLLDALKI